MRLTSYGFVCFSTLTLGVACSDDAYTPPPDVGGSAGSDSGGSDSGGSAMAGTSSGGTSSGSTSLAGTTASAGTGGGGAGGAGGSSAGGSGGGGAGGSGGGAGMAGGGSGGAAPNPVCGNGKKENGEACDDGDKDPNDGCSATCTVETGYECPTEGAACMPVCGDGVIVAPEKCDDENTVNGDGCSSGCSSEMGWECQTAGQPCTSVCGDGKLVGEELCDDGDEDPNDGCSATCTPEGGFVCDVPGQSCRKKPDCTAGACTSTCGDGLVIGEACDDGNLDNDDGCSSTCTVEDGFSCETVAADLPAQLAIPVTYRDFVSVAAGGSVKFPDQQAFQGNGITPGMVEASLGADGLPVYTGICEKGGPNEGNAQKCPYGAQTTSKTNFDKWYSAAEGDNLVFPGVVRLDRQGQTQAYVFDGGDTFTPLTGKGWDKQGKEGLVNGRNFGFTTELRYFFAYQGDEVLAFAGDDDVWVFINGKLAVDIGGLHPKQDKSVTLGVQKSAELGLTLGKVYELALFHAERAPDKSNFKLTLTGFLNSTSKCKKN
ncbi:MAG TPA: DUF4215 domain-containing protein [Polyangiaceae bacterium]|nr:DUF4215 domain-containing protein [Polyangiaceae bacterium]